MTPSSSASAVIDLDKASSADLRKVGAKKDEKPSIPARIPVLPTKGALIEGRDGNRFVATLYKAYELHPDILKGLAKLADADCYKCKASGISRWRSGGLKAQVCACVLAKQDRVEEFMKTVAPDAGEVA